MTDFIRYLKATADSFGDQFGLEQLAPGDELKVVTHHTEYVLSIVNDRTADLISSRSDRPNARVKIMGCTFGNSSSIKPNYLFCGGNLEFTYEQDGQLMVHKTTAIKEIYWRRETR